MMAPNNDRSDPVRRESARHRALLATTIGLCLTVPSAAVGEASGIQRFRARSELGSVLLTWTLPAATTFSRVVIRFQVDGPAPLSPTDGSPLFDERTPSGAMYGKRHTGLSPQHFYSYAAFALDAFGLVRASTTAVGTPLPLQLPATVQNLRWANPEDTRAAAPAAGSAR